MSNKLVKVIEVRNDPRRGNPPLVRNADFGYGIDKLESARKWGERKGYALVYWWSVRNRVFAEMTSRKDESLVEFAKRLSEGADDGQGL